MYASRLQVLLTIVAGLFLLGTIAIFAVFALAPGTALVYRPLLLTAFVVTLFIIPPDPMNDSSVLCPTHAVANVTPPRHRPCPPE